MALSAVVALGTWLLLSDLRARAIAAESRELERLALVLSDQADRALQSTELVQTSLLERMESLVIISAEDYRQQMTTEDVHHELRTRIAALPQLDAITLIDADGTLLNFSRYWPIPSVNVSDRDYFKALKADPKLERFVSEPVPNRGTGTWTIYIARRFSAPDGAFLGLVLGAIELRYFEDFFRSVALGDDGSISLFRRDGILLARHPNSAPAIGRSYADSAVFRRIQAGADSGAVRQVSPIDGRDRIVATHGLAHYPVVVNVTNTVDGALRDWRDQAKYLGATAALLILSIAGGVLLAVRQARGRDLLQAANAARAEAEAELRLLQERKTLAAVVAASPIGIMTLDTAGRFQLWNQASEQIFGYCAEEMIGRPYTVLVPEEDRPAAEARLHRVLAGETVSGIPMRRRCKNGAVIDISFSAASLRDPEGVTRGCVVLLENVTDRLRTEAELRRTRAFLDQVIENIPVSVFVKEAPEQRFVLMNRAAGEMLGLRHEEVIGKTDHDFFPREQAESFVTCDQKVLESSQPLLVEEEPIDTPHHGRRLLRTTKVPVAGENGRPHFLLCVSEDITERRRAEEEIRAANETLSALIEASPVAIVGLDRELNVQTWNRTAERIFGFAAAEMLGEQYAAIVPEDGREGLERLVERLLGGEIIRNARVQRRRKDGTLLEINASGTVLFGRDGTARGFVIALEDITERQLIEDQLRQSQKMEAVGQLTGGLAHDFNNLLGVIIGNLDLLRDQLGTEPETADIIDQALEAALRGADLNRQLLAFARRQPLQPQRIDINALVARAAKLLARTLGETIEVRLSLAVDIGTGLADPTQLETALTNLAVNARDAMPQGGRLTIATHNVVLDADYAAVNQEVQGGDYVALEITDSGTGMAPEVLARAFEPFFTTKEAGKGTGLGLSMVFGFAKQSGGHVKIYSEVGHGTTVRLYLPRAADETADNTTDTSGKAAPLPRGRETVLVVEDNEKLRRVLLRQLAELGYAVIEAEDAREALALLRTGRPVDLLLTDIAMPGGMNGWELAREAARLRPGIKALYTSGFPNAAFGTGSALPEGALLLGKPYRTEELARLLREAVAA
jgi:PAS domain S-box-containing protein